jgi:hypothetical protein
MADQKINIIIQALDKTKGAFGTITRSIKAVTAAVFSFKTAIVGVIGAGGIGLLVRQSIMATDTLGKTATKLGVTTEALGQLRYAAELSGVSIQTTDMAVQRFTRRMAEAAAGGGEAKAALIELGLNAKTLAQLPLEEQMIELSKAFGKVNSASDQVRLAFKLFDSEGVAFVNILKEGEDGLRAMFQEANTLGAVLSGTAVKGVERASDAFYKLQTLFSGIINQVVAALAPALEALANKLRDSVVTGIFEANGSIEKFAKTIAQKLLTSLADTLRGFASFLNGMDRIVNSVVDTINVFREWRGQTRLARVAMSGLEQSALDAAFFIEGLSLNLAKVESTLVSTEDKVERSISTLDRLREAFAKLQNESVNLQDEFDKGVKKAFDGVTDAITGMIMGTKSAKDAFKDMARSIIADLIRLQVQRSITQPLFAALQSFIPGSTPAPTGKAIGGSVQSGQPYMVGERGPEMFIPNRQGSIVSKSSNNESPVNVTLNISTGVSQTVRAEIAQLMPQIANATKAAVLDARRRGGSFAGAFGA